jgi:adenylylsulfate kinase
LSGSGKSTLAHAVEDRLHRRGCQCFVLDGDNVRHGLCGDLGFSVPDRKENIRLFGEVAKLFMEAGTIVLTAFISPYRADRRRARAMVEKGDFLEIYCNAQIEVCEARDVKGMYKKARAGHIAEFTGVSSPYEIPEQPDLIVETGRLELDECVSHVMKELERRGVITRQ